MAFNSDTLENVLNPEEAFREYKKYLMEAYMNDYGEEYSRIIKKRMDDTYYLFESNPVDTYNFYKKYKNSLFGFRRQFRIEREYSNYISVKRKIDKRLREKYKEVLCGFYSTLPGFIDDSFLIVDFDSFSFENIKKIHSDNVSEAYKEKILKRQSKYISFCELYGLKPITDFNVIDKMIKIRRNIEYEEFKALLDETIWGKRIKKEIYDRTGSIIDTRVLGALMFDKKSCASVCRISSLNGDPVLVCFFPIMKNYDVGSIDKIFFHENRHVIESSDDICGFTPISSKEYMLINELRTQENAIRDASLFINMPLFSNSSEASNFVNVYERLFDYCGPFIKKYLFLLNNLGVNNSVSNLEYLFGRENLFELENYLVAADNSFYDRFPNKIDLEKQKVFNRRLDNHFFSRL